MLTFTDYPAECSKPTYGEEHHGNEVVKNVSVYLTASVGADQLESIKSGLRDALFVRPAINDSARLDDNGGVHDLIRRFPSMEAVKFEDDYPGCDLTLHKSELFDDDTYWSDVEIGKFSVEAKDGGTAIVKFRVQMRGAGLAFWVEMMNRATRITLTPPKDKPLPANHPDAPKDDPNGDVFKGTEFARDKQDDADSRDDDMAGAPEGLDAARLAEANRDAAESTQRKAAVKRGRKSNGAAATVQ